MKNTYSITFQVGDNNSSSNNNNNNNATAAKTRDTRSY